MSLGPNPQRPALALAQPQALGHLEQAQAAQFGQRPYLVSQQQQQQQAAVMPYGLRQPLTAQERAPTYSGTSSVGHNIEGLTQTGYLSGTGVGLAPGVGMSVQRGAGGEMARHIGVAGGGMGTSEGAATHAARGPPPPPPPAPLSAAGSIAGQYMPVSQAAQYAQQSLGGSQPHAQPLTFTGLYAPFAGSMQGLRPQLQQAAGPSGMPAAAPAGAGPSSGAYSPAPGVTVARSTTASTPSNPTSATVKVSCPMSNHDVIYSTLWKQWQLRPGNARTLSTEPVGG